ncbi:hypothetical protein EDB81DRAFT_771629 [Dactylonectria macrodidyma]|uniref:Uncharacterized protein n=1 Tax=Dactylonectria macrodidyma TaxID=307937 RepID=A0A9P9FT51_9HYPO|nr:hypothetical protein EDB81DRAFT_771629 [Dactylonectria macrodidyma]
MPSRLPRFLILDEPIPPSEIPQLLGRFVCDYNSPLDRFAPATVPEFVSTHVKEYGEKTAVSLVLQNERSESVKAKLEQIFSLSASQGAVRRLDIASDVIKTYRLHEQDVVFDTFMASPELKKQVNGLFRKPGHRTNKVYMIVGLKTLLDANVKREWGRQKGKQASVQMPLQAALAAGGVLAGKTLNIGVELQTNTDITISAEAKHTGEQIFAIEYRVIKKSLLSKLNRSRPDVTFGGIMNWGWGEGVMGAGENKEDDDSEEENSDTRLPALKQSEVDGSGGLLWEVDGA